MKLRKKRLNSLIKGTLILSAAALVSRAIGFLYRIYLTRTIGAEEVGIFQLVTPVAGIVFALCCEGIVTAVSRYVAGNNNSVRYLYAGLLISIPASTLLSIVTYCMSDYIAACIIHNERCSDCLALLSFSFPFAAFHNCVNGYYYGKKCTSIPAASQLFEQTVRVLSVCAYASFCTAANIPVTVTCAIAGNIIGEIAATLFCVISLMFKKDCRFRIKPAIAAIPTLLTYSAPLTFNHFLMHLLQAGEAILIPTQLMLSGNSQQEALSLYGVLTGMVLPLILFPGVLTNSLSVMLLPEVSKAGSVNDTGTIIKTFERTLLICFTIGIMCTLLFLFYGASIGTIIFDEPAVYPITLVIAWLCPFMYLSSTLGSILNGLSYTTTNCIHNIISILIRIIFLVICVPHYGLRGYLIGLLVSQIFLCFSHYITISRTFHITIDTYSLIILPLFYCITAIGISLCINSLLEGTGLFNEPITLCVGIFTACISLLLMLRGSRSFRIHMFNIDMRL